MSVCPRRAGGGSAALAALAAPLGDRLLEPRLQGEHHRALRDGRLQPDAGDLPVRAAGAVRVRPGGQQLRDRAERDPRPPAAVPERGAGGARRTRSTACARARRRSASRRRSAESGSAPRSGARWTRPSAASTTSSAGAGSQQKRFSLVMLLALTPAARRQRRRARRSRARRSPAPTICPGGSTSSASSARRSSSSAASRSPSWSSARSTGRCRRATCLGAPSGRERSSSRPRSRSRNYVFPLYLTSVSDLQPDRRHPRLHPRRADLVLRGQPRAAGRGGDQLAAPRARRHRHPAAGWVGSARNGHAPLEPWLRSRETARPSRSCPTPRRAPSRPPGRCARCRRRRSRSLGTSSRSCGRPRRWSASLGPTGATSAGSRWGCCASGTPAAAATWCSGGAGWCCCGSGRRSTTPARASGGSPGRSSAVSSSPARGAGGATCG